MMRFQWNGAAMIPVRPDAARGVYELGRKYWLDEVSERSWISHSHEFAWVAAAWDNLPEPLQDKFPTPEALRKAALIATGWCREVVIDAGSKPGAQRVAGYVSGRDEFSQVVVRGATVIVRTARSQRMRGHDRMDRKEFEDSKQAILGWISELIGVSAEDLKAAAA
jgi:hypothetical protein